jgi:hypothetical protein
MAYPGMFTEETRPGHFTGQSPLEMDAGTPTLMDRMFPRKWINRSIFDAPGARKAIVEDALPPETFPGLDGGGGKPEHLSVPPSPPGSTGTKYPDLRSQIAEMAQPEHDAERRAAAARINAAMPRPVPAPSGPETPGPAGTLHYSVGGGPMRSRAPGQGGPAGEDFSATQGHGFGETWKPGGGGYMQADINSLPYEQKPESYRATHMSPADLAMSPAGAEAAKSNLQEDVEKRRRGDYEASVNHLRGLATQAIQQAQSLPEAERAKAIEGINTDLEDRLKTVTQSFGIGARMTSNALYSGF